MFSGLRQNALIYILEKGETPTLKVGQVVSVSNPTPRYSQPTNPYSAFSQNVEQVVDISVKTDDGTAVDFKQLPASLAIANQGNVVVADNKEAMTSEVEAMLRTSRSVVESVDYHKRVIGACDTMLQTLNPQFAKEREQEQKIGLLEEKVTGMEGTLSDIRSMLSKALNTSAAKTKN